MSDMRDDLDELGRRLWPATDALQPTQLRSHATHTARRVRRFEPLATLAAAILLIGVISGAVALGRSLSSRTPAPAAPSVSPPIATTAPTTGASPSATPSPTAPPTAGVIVWAASGSSTTAIRVGTAAGGFRTVATIPATTGPSILGAGGHRVLFSEAANGHLYDVDINTGAVTDHGGGTGETFAGAAFSPDGSQVEYLRKATPDSGQIRRLDLDTGAITGLQDYTGSLDVPRVWSAAGIGATEQGGGDTGLAAAGFAILDPSTGAPVATTDSSADSWAIATDGIHAAQVESSQPGTVVNPAMLATVVIGSSPQVQLHGDANHFLQVHGISRDGSTVLFSDEPTMGGYAGITLSPDYGLFTLSSGHRAQVAHFSGSNNGYLGAAYLGATDFVIVHQTAGPAGTTNALELSSAGGPPVSLDTGIGSAASVYVVTG